MNSSLNPVFLFLVQRSVRGRTEVRAIGFRLPRPALGEATCHFVPDIQNKFFVLFSGIRKSALAFFRSQLLVRVSFQILEYFPHLVAWFCLDRFKRIPDIPVLREMQSMEVWLLLVSSRTFPLVVVIPYPVYGSRSCW